MVRKWGVAETVSRRPLSPVPLAVVPHRRLSRPEPDLTQPRPPAFPTLSRGGRDGHKGAEKD